MAVRSWQFLGGPGTWPYRLYDAQRRWLNRRLVRFLLGRTGLETGARVLEGGAGPGFASALFAEAQGAGLSVAADIDREALEEGRRRCGGLQAVAADLFRLPFRSKSFDLVWNSSTLEHLEPPAEAVREMARVAKPGGFVFIGVPYRRGPLGFQPWIRASRVGVWIGPVFGRCELAQLAAGAGLAPQETVTYYFGCFVGVLARKPHAPGGGEDASVGETREASDVGGCDGGGELGGCRCQVVNGGGS